VPPPHGAGDPFVPLLPTMSFEAFCGGGANGNGAGARAPAAAPAPAPDALLAAWDELGVSRSGSGSRGSSRGLAMLAQGLVPSLDSLGSVGDWQVRARGGRRACTVAHGGARACTGARGGRAGRGALLQDCRVCAQLRTAAALGACLRLSPVRQPLAAASRSRNLAAHGRAGC